jgi:cytochrome c oxidase subunit 1
LTGLVLGQTALDMVMHDTYFVTGHFHLIMGVAAVFGIFAATYYWFPKMFGRMMNERLGRLHFWLTFSGAYAIFVPFHLLGVAGHPRRYADSLWFEFLRPLDVLHWAATHAALLTAAAQLLFLVNLGWSLRRGERAGPNPWAATTLEWATLTPVPPDNFGAVLPVAHRDPYDYGAHDGARDFRMQSED